MRSEISRLENPAKKTRVTAEQVRLLFASAPLAVASSTLLAVILVYMQRDVISSAAVMGWFALVVLVALARAVLIVAYRRASGTRSFNSSLWLNRFRFWVLAAGLAWGSAGFLMFPADDEPHQMFLTFLLAGLSAGGMVTYSADLVSAAVYIATVLMPFVVRLFVEGDGLSLAMGMAGILYMGFTLFSVRYMYQHMRENIVLHIDATTREEVLRESEERYRLLLRHSPIGILHYDTDLIITYCNVRFADILHTRCERLIGLDMKRLKDESVLPALRKVLEGENGYYEGHYDATGSDASIDISMSCAPSLDGKGRIMGGIAIIEDITERKKAQQEIYTLAFYDPLTQLPNRRLMLDRLQHALATRGRNGREGALLFIDLDHFKMLNDTLGHDKGDLLLQQVAQRLKQCVRESDTIARLGGDEYVVILEDLSGDAHEAATQMESAGEKILSNLRHPFNLDGHVCHMTASIGVSPFGEHRFNVDELLKQADLAMYQAKAIGRNALRFFDPEMQAVLSARTALEADLREGLQQAQFALYYQPQVNASGHVVGAEALLRWRHPVRGMVSPAEFIPLAEATGLIVPLGHWVLETACAQLVTWASRPATAHLTMAVNVSASQFHMTDFVDQVLAVIDHSGVNPDGLKLELTESLLLDNVEDTIVKMTALKQWGVRFSLDDFGTGYSSLSYLKRLPLDQLKIDKSFVMDVEFDENAAAICAATIGLAHSLNYSVVAEGVETAAQRYFLTTVHGCDFMQGYLFERPLPLAEFEALLSTGKPLPIQRMF